jgi:F0F1-type ATP synthase gamma subunit
MVREVRVPTPLRVDGALRPDLDPRSCRSRSQSARLAREARRGDVILEPDPETIFDQLLPRYLDTRVYNALVEAITSEYASRRARMKNATEPPATCRRS